MRAPALGKWDPEGMMLASGRAAKVGERSATYGVSMGLAKIGDGWATRFATGVRGRCKVATGVATTTAVLNAKCPIASTCRLRLAACVRRPEGNI